MLNQEILKALTLVERERRNIDDRQCFSITEPPTLIKDLGPIAAELLDYGRWMAYTQIEQMLLKGMAES